jgi:hypothetical protein
MTYLRKVELWKPLNRIATEKDKERKARARLQGARLPFVLAAQRERFREKNERRTISVTVPTIYQYKPGPEEKRKAIGNVDMVAVRLGLKRMNSKWLLFWRAVTRPFRWLFRIGPQPINKKRKKRNGGAK